jgi:lipopolysaccharide biosynthesis regulator YciM
MAELDKEKALTVWRDLFQRPEGPADAERQYDLLLRIAEEYRQKGIIDNAEWRRLAEEAVAFYARSIKDGSDKSQHQNK